MEPVHDTSNASEEDVLSSMPENVITHILDPLPVQDAVRTGILSRDWRFKWNMLTQLVFDNDFFKPSNQNERNVISRILLQLKGSITKFDLVIPHYKTVDVEEVSIWVMFLSTKGIKEFTVINYHQTPLKLPTHLFSCLRLNHLELDNCCFHTPPTFCGFPNLQSLHLCNITDIGGNFVELITKCPLLEILIITDFDSSGKVKLVDIAKLKNLKMLALRLHILADVGITSSTIFQLGDYLPKLQELTLNFHECKFIGETGTRKYVHTIFPCLKTLQLFEIDLNSYSMLSCTIEMIWGSPNLQSLTIVPKYENEDDDPPPALFSSEADYNTFGQLQLRHAFIVTYFGSVNEVCLIKYLFSCSPLLEKIIIESSGMCDGKLELAKKLLMFPRASTVAEVELRS